MICPRCNTPTLEERERDGITIDVCRSCRGIWLDRGELERLIARASDDMPRDTRMPDHGHRHHDQNDHHGHDHHHRKRHWLAELFD